MGQLQRVELPAPFEALLTYHPEQLLPRRRDRADCGQTLADQPLVGRKHIRVVDLPADRCNLRRAGVHLRLARNCARPIVKHFLSTNSTIGDLQRAADWPAPVQPTRATAPSRRAML